jgi:prepilin-type N-terminal cleavage/methylation domain-containing protein
MRVMLDDDAYMFRGWISSCRRAAELRLRPGSCGLIGRSVSAFRAGFTLIELLIIISILAILASFVIPMLGSTTDLARIETMSTNTSHVRGIIVYHAGAADAPLSAGGFPLALNAAWFKNGKVPDHAWTDQPMIVEVVNGPANHVYPAVKTYDTSNTAAPNAWYNNMSGAFCARVPPRSDIGETLQMFNDVNKTSATAIGQTTE